MWGNIVLGGGIGAIVDHNNGTAYEYPSLLKIYMGRSGQRFEATSSEQAATAKPTQDPQAAKGQMQASTQVTAITNTQNSVPPSAIGGLDDAKRKCQDIGFAPATEQFGTCVLKLIGK